MPRKPKLRVRSPWNIMCEAVEGGINYGWFRSWKHRPMPDEITPEVEMSIKEALRMAIENELAEAFDFDA